jgi:hypothetical protein
MSQRVDVGESDVPLTTLDRRDVSSVQARTLGQGFLRQLGEFPELTNAVAKLLASVHGRLYGKVAPHQPMIWACILYFYRLSVTL